MAQHTITNASLEGIYNKLNEIARYHPLEADTFADWSMEAGDIVTVERESDSYESPVHSTRMVWKKTPETTISSGGNEKREAISKVSERKYNRGGGGLRATRRVYDSVLVAYDNMVAGLEVTASWASLYVNNLYDQMKAGLDLTSSSASLYVQSMYDQMKAGLDLTMSSASLYVESAYDQMKAGLDLTMSSASLYVQSAYDQMKAGLDLTMSSASLYVQGAYDQMKAGLDLTMSTAALYVQNSYTQMKSGLEVTMSSAVLYARDRTTRAYIMTRINANGEGEALINADKVSIDGATTINDVLIISDNRAQFQRPIRVVGDILGETLSLREGASSVSIDESDLEGMIKSASVEDGVLTLTPVRGDPITFRKTTSVSGSWGGTNNNVFTAVPSANGTPSVSATVYPQLVGTNLHDYFYSTVITYDDNEHEVEHGNPLYGYLIEQNNGDDHYVIVNTESDGTGRTVAKLEITSGSITSITLTGGWANGLYNVIAKDQNDTQVGSMTYDPLLELNGATTDENFTARIYEIEQNVHVARKSVAGKLVILGSNAGSYVDVKPNLDGTGTSVARVSVGYLYTDGQNSITINKGSWSNGNITFNKSAGTNTPKTVKLEQGALISLVNNVASIQVLDTSVGSVDTGCIITYNAGPIYKDGQDSVAINKGEWSNGNISFTKSAGTGNPKTVKLEQGSYSLNENKILSIQVLDKSVGSVDTGCNITFNAGTIYSDGRDDEADTLTVYAPTNNSGTLEDDAARTIVSIKSSAKTSRSETESTPKNFTLGRNPTWKTDQRCVELREDGTAIGRISVMIDYNDGEKAEAGTLSITYPENGSGTLSANAERTTVRIQATAKTANSSSKSASTPFYLERKRYDKSSTAKSQRCVELVEAGTAIGRIDVMADYTDGQNAEANSLAVNAPTNNSGTLDDNDARTVISLKSFAETTNAGKTASKNFTLARRTNWKTDQRCVELREDGTAIGRISIMADYTGVTGSISWSYEEGKGTGATANQGIVATAKLSNGNTAADTKHVKMYQTPFSNHKKKVQVRNSNASYSTNGTILLQTEVDASSEYEAGKAAAYPSSASLTRTAAQIDYNGGSVYKGKLYRWNVKNNKYEACTSSDYYWYYSSTNIGSGSHTVHY